MTPLSPEGAREHGLRVLVACEFSGVVREAFRRRGFDAWSCDLLPALDHSPWHLQVDILEVLAHPEIYGAWCLLIAHPPCDRLLVSGALHWKKWQASGEQQKAIVFFMQLALCRIPLKAIENPVGIMNTCWRQPDQIIQPYQFGHGETKKTCLWLEGLPLLKPTCEVPGREQRVHKESPGKKNGLTRSQRRSIFFPGIADAMAEQWGPLLVTNTGNLSTTFPEMLQIGGAQ